MTVRNQAPPGKTGDHDLDQIRRTIELLVAPGDVHEVRVLGSARKRIDAGYFSDAEALARAAARCNGKGQGVYLTLN